MNNAPYGHNTQQQPKSIEFKATADLPSDQIGPDAELQEFELLYRWLQNTWRMGIDEAKPVGYCDMT